MTIERNIPTEKRFANDETSDGCTESNCPRCLTHPDHRGDIRHAGIGSYPEPDRVMWKGFQIAEDRSVPAHMILVRDSRGVSTITSAGRPAMTDMHREAFERWWLEQKGLYNRFEYELSFLAWCAAMRYLGEQEKQA